jgi:hypothetical protein
MTNNLIVITPDTSVETLKKVTDKLIKRIHELNTGDCTKVIIQANNMYNFNLNFNSERKQIGPKQGRCCSYPHKAAQSTNA